MFQNRAREVGSVATSIPVYKDTPHFVIPYTTSCTTVGSVESLNLRQYISMYGTH